MLSFCYKFTRNIFLSVFFKSKKYSKIVGGI